MEAIEKLKDGSEIYLNFAQATHAGYGHKKISVELEYNGNFKTFSATTSNMPDYDEATEEEDYKKKQIMFYELVKYAISDEVEEWIDEL